MHKRFPIGSSKIKALLVVAPVVALAGVGGWIWYQQQPHYAEIKVYKPTTKVVQITGEVVDAWCYASQTMGPGRGIGHLACATACVGGGVTAGILEDNTGILYIAAKYKGYQGCRELLLPLIGKKVIAYGWVGDLGGNRLLKISSVKLLKPESKAQSNSQPNARLNAQADAQVDMKAQDAQSTSEDSVSKTTAPKATAPKATAGGEDCPMPEHSQTATHSQKP